MEPDHWVVVTYKQLAARCDGGASASVGSETNVTRTTGVDTEGMRTGATEAAVSLHVVRANLMQV